MAERTIALVTGASRGIGRAIALELAGRGCHVVGTATSPAGVEKITSSLREAGLSGEGRELDLREPSSVEKLAEALKEASLEPAILVNNAGITRDNLLLRMKEEEWAEVVETNLNAVFRLTKACLRGMMKARWGRIINISSVVGLMGNPGQANYAATKAGMIGFSKSLAHEVAARGVTVNVIAPGFIATDMTQALSEEQRAGILEGVPMGRLGEPENIAKAVAFLASEDASYITGHTLHVNGGMLMP